MMSSLDADEIVPAVAALCGAPRQGKIGIGWATSRVTGRASAPSLTIGDLDRTLSELAVTTGSGSQAARRALLDDLAGRATPAESDFIRRLLIGELRQGALAGLVQDAVAKAAGLPAPSVRRAAMLTGDLPHTAWLALTEGAPALDAIGLRVGTAVQPMLASPGNDVADALDGMGSASVEWKLDGVRIQAHRDGDEVHLFTRNLNDVTDRDSRRWSTSMRSMAVDSVILDGEIIGVSEEGLPDAFQDSMSSFGRSKAGPADDPVGGVVRRVAPRRCRPDRSPAVGTTRRDGLDRRPRPNPVDPNRRPRRRAAGPRRGDSRRATKGSWSRT